MASTFFIVWMNWVCKNDDELSTRFDALAEKIVTKWSQMPISVGKWVFWSYCVENCNLVKRLEKIDGAEGETRTRMGLLPLDPESTEWVFGKWLNLCNYLIFKDFADIHNIQESTRYTQYKQYMDKKWSKENMCKMQWREIGQLRNVH